MNRSDAMRDISPQRRNLRRIQRGMADFGPGKRRYCALTARRSRGRTCRGEWGFGSMGLSGAGEGNRTLVISLEGFCSTIELHPHTPATVFSCPRETPRLPQLAARHCICYIDRDEHGTTETWWREKDSNLRRLSRQIYSLIPLTAWVSLRPGSPAL